MRQTLVSNIIVSSLLSVGLTLGLSAAAQAAPQRYPDHQSPYGAYSGQDFRDSRALFDRVRSDLDIAEGNLPSYSYSRDRFDRVRGELSELQRNWDENTYEPRQADVVIAALDRVLATSDLMPRDHDRLSDDMSRLREFRDNHE
jgi:hypothetical protein